MLTGCATPIHLYGTEQISKDQLTIIKDRINEVRILEIDGKKYLGEHGQPVYLKPGVHKIIAKLVWTDLIPIGGGVLINSLTETSIFLRTGCLDMKSGKSYSLNASDSSKNWRLTYLESVGSGFNLESGFRKIDVPSCY